MQTFGAGAPTRLAEQRPTTPASVLAFRHRPAPLVPGPRRRLASTSSPTRSVATAAPTYLTISGTGISARVVPVGVDASGATAIPQRVDTVGWYRFGPQPGASAGSVVWWATSTRPSRAKERSSDCIPCDPAPIVSVTGTDRQVFRYRVVGRQEYPKSSVPLAALFTRTGAPHLTLITCGGSFDRQIRHYRDNVVVTAVPSP